MLEQILNKDAPVCASGIMHSTGTRIGIGSPKALCSNPTHCKDRHAEGAVLHQVRAEPSVRSRAGRALAVRATLAAGAAVAVGSTASCRLVTAGGGRCGAGAARALATSPTLAIRPACASRRPTRRRAGATSEAVTHLRFETNPKDRRNQRLTACVLKCGHNADGLRVQRTCRLLHPRDSQQRSLNGARTTAADHLGRDLENMFRHRSNLKIAHAAVCL
mmetsp:Transcript_93697/g.201056  ORF Transcript_93697/g.201056 Transcript_93697/m.201056 type:complete len:219 (+) Transcript_93697:91-747(+)